MKRFLLSLIFIVGVGLIAGVVHYGVDRANENPIEFVEGPKNTTTVQIPKKATGENEGSEREGAGDDPAVDQPEDSAPERVADDVPVADPGNERAEASPAGFDPAEVDCTSLTLDSELTLEQAWCLFINDHADGRDLAVFIDARPKDQFELGHIEGALNMPKEAFKDSEPIGLGIVEEDQYVIVYCGGGDCEDSNFVARDIAMYRFDLEPMIYIFKDGYPAWEDAGLPTEDGPDLFAE